MVFRPWSEWYERLSGRGSNGSSGGDCWRLGSKGGSSQEWCKAIKYGRADFVCEVVLLLRLLLLELTNLLSKCCKFCAHVLKLHAEVVGNAVTVNPRLIV